MPNLYRTDKHKKYIFIQFGLIVHIRGVMFGDVILSLSVNHNSGATQRQPLQWRHTVCVSSTTVAPHGWPRANNNVALAVH